MQRVANSALTDRFEYAGELDRASKIAFLQSLDVMGVATMYHESKGLSVLEVAGQRRAGRRPRHGSFPEILEHTGGGLLCEPENPADLAAKLREFVLNPALVDDHGRQGREAIFQHYSAAQMAAQHRRFIAGVLPALPGVRDPSNVVNTACQRVARISNRHIGIISLPTLPAWSHAASAGENLGDSGITGPSQIFPHVRPLLFATKTLRPLNPDGTLPIAG